ncbi:MAG: winged helix-turn-helix transcriptional regulator [Rhizobiaceae bacterium]|nr:winged helix-turn-helix transcriptional regulator [Rhizobiaceae bacterium]
MSAEKLLETVFAGELRELMVLSYIVLGNNAVTNRCIERRFGMPVQAWSALYAIGTFPGIRAKEIRQLFPRPQNTISRAVTLLEGRGLVVQKISPSDAREKLLFATKSGKEMLSQLIEVSRDRQEEWLSPLTPDERSMFFELARKVATGPNLLCSTVMTR